MEFNEAVPYVVAAYMGIWTILVAYVVVVNNKLSGLNKELVTLSRALERKTSK